MKHTIVIFDIHGARMKTVDDITPYKKMANVLIDPDLSKVKGIPPHHWRMENSEVVPNHDAIKSNKTPPHDWYAPKPPEPKKEVITAQPKPEAKREERKPVPAPQPITHATKAKPERIKIQWVQILISVSISLVGSALIHWLFK